MYCSPEGTKPARMRAGVAGQQEDGAPGSCNCVSGPCTRPVMLQAKLRRYAYICRASIDGPVKTDCVDAGEKVDGAKGGRETLPGGNIFYFCGAVNYESVLTSPT